jgi:hypothetical protein
MNTGSSFFALFKKGRYYRGPSEDDESPEAKRERRDRERFIAAGLVFCLKHDEDFRRSFWEKVCRVPDDPREMPPIADADVELEPAAWADLRLTSRSPSDRIVWVIEIKTGARLLEKQQPWHDDFHLTETGYGRAFCESEVESTRKRYIILGAKETMRLPPIHEPLKIALRRVQWSDVADCSQ